jgi:phage-related protein
VSFPSELNFGKLSFFCYSLHRKRIWTVEFLDDVVEAEFLAIPKDLQARLVRITDLIESYGLENLGMPHVRHLQDKIWEIRGKGRSGFARALYVAVVGSRVVILRVFVKKSPKTPPGEIALALSRMKEIEHG